MKNIFLFASVLIADRLTKLWAFYNLANNPISVCYGFNFLLLWNRGVSWSLFVTDTAFGFWLLTTCIATIIAGFSVYTWMRFARSLSIFFEVLVLAGALSNLADRFIYGAVLDFIQWYVGSFYWPVFNIADASIVVGISGIMIRTWWCPDESDVKKSV